MLDVGPGRGAWKGATIAWGLGESYPLLRKESLSMGHVLTLITESPLLINAPLRREFYLGRAQRKRPSHKLKEISELFFNH